MRALPYAQHLDEGLPKGPNDVQNLPVEVIRLEKGAPPHEDGVCNLQDAVCDLVVGVGEAADEVLRTRLVSGVRLDCQKGSWRTWVSVSQRSQKSESAIRLMASPSCVCIVGGDEIIRPTSSCLMVCTSS